MNWNALIRQTHRWLSIVFVLTVIANFIALAVHRQTVWVGLMALAPLFLLMFSGLYMFFRPYFAKQQQA
jgi:hypothetical protein